MGRRGSIAVLLVVFGLTGCIDLRIEVSLDQEGIATANLSARMLDQMYQNLAFLGPQIGLDTSFLKEEGARAYLGEAGGTLDSYENTLEQGFRQIRMTATIPEGRTWLGALGRGQTELIETEDGFLEWRLLSEDTGLSLLAMDDAMIQQQLSILGPQLAGLRCRLQIRVPQLKDTNLTKVDGQTAAFDLDYDRDLGEKSGADAVRAFRAVFSPKWLRFSLKPNP